ncbi:uncharacterized protein LOC124192160 isoform X2 [Daphnia pulex]|uniref:uncharacterized protein LOC124192160 isoform X2 n=1 Tax=Daphnia pulex TaxID=6669 RepID=UPI001EDDB3FE|nr:uncharacterized protein LOC124192160 isoform X2 [Daphnia pulex]
MMVLLFMLFSRVSSLIGRNSALMYTNVSVGVFTRTPFSCQLTYFFGWSTFGCLAVFPRLKADRSPTRKMNNMKTISAFYLVCIFIVLFTYGINAIRTHPDAELKNGESSNGNSIRSLLFGRPSESDWRENSRMASISKGRAGWSSLVDKLQNYISSYTSSTATWLTYPYYGISTGVVSVIVICVVIYILIVVSGSVVTTSGRSFIDHMGVNTEELDRLAHTVLNAVDHLATKLNRNGRSADPPKDRDSARLKVTGTGGPAWSTSVTQYDSVSDYLSANLYDKLIWLSKPFAGYILSMGGILLYMVIIVIITMTSGVFPISTLGRQLRGSRPELNQDANLIRTAEFVMEAINLWMDKRHAGNSLKDD